MCVPKSIDDTRVPRNCYQKLLPGAATIHPPCTNGRTIRLLTHSTPVNIPAYDLNTNELTYQYQTISNDIKRYHPPKANVTAFASDAFVMGRAQLKTLAEVIMKKAIPSVNAELNADPLIFPPALVPLVRYIIYMIFHPLRYS